MEDLGCRWLRAWNKQTIFQSLAVARLHYSLGPELWECMLGPTMNYTCGYWKPDTKTLEEAQINKMDLVARKLKLKPGSKVLDLGCGWGSAAQYMAKHYKVSVVAYSICKEQIEYARKRCEGLDVTFICDDYRNATGKFDAIYSIGLYEHIGHTNGPAYFQVLDRCLTAEGVALIQTTVSADNEIRACLWVSTLASTVEEHVSLMKLLIISFVYNILLSIYHCCRRTSIFFRVANSHIPTRC